MWRMSKCFTNTAKIKKESGENNEINKHRINVSGIKVKQKKWSSESETGISKDFI